MAEVTELRADKFLWAVRLYKTRSLAAEACKKGRILVEDIPLKAARNIRTGDIIQVKKPPVNYTYKVLSIPKSRMGAKLVPTYLEDLTPEKELLKLRMTDSFFLRRERGSGRPTKKERREIDKLKDE